MLHIAGADCSVPANKGVWMEVDSSNSAAGLPRAVASHSSFVYEKYLWIVGGYSFQLPSAALKTFQ